MFYFEEFESEHFTIRVRFYLVLPGSAPFRLIWGKEISLEWQPLRCNREPWVTCFFHRNASKIFLSIRTCLMEDFLQFINQPINQFMTTYNKYPTMTNTMKVTKVL